MPSAPLVTYREHREMHALHAEGRSAHWIALAMGRNTRTVVRHLGESYRPRPDSDERREAVFRAYERVAPGDRQDAAAEIAGLYGYANARSVARLVSEMRCQRRRQAETERRAAETTRSVAHYWALGLDTLDIARMLGLAEAEACCALARLQDERHAARRASLSVARRHCCPVEAR